MSENRKPASQRLAFSLLLMALLVVAIAVAMRLSSESALTFEREDFAGAEATDWPMLGHDETRNSVSPEKNGPTEWQIESHDELGRRVLAAENIRWSAQLGSQTLSTPVVSQGLVWIGTNFGDARSGSALKCFRETDGTLAYEYVSQALESPRYLAEQRNGLACSPLVEGGHLWFTTTRYEVVCLDIAALVAGKGKPREVWKLDMIKSLGVFPHSRENPKTCSIAASYKDRIYVVTGNGVALDFQTIPSPDAPSLVCLNKITGQIEWADRSRGSNVLKVQLANPLVAEIQGRGQVIVAQGDGWLRSFEPSTGKLLWKFDMSHKTGRPADVLATPVLYDDHVYVATGNPPEQGEGVGRLVCVDPTWEGDISSELENGAANPNSGLAWEYIQQDQNQNRIIEFEETFHLTIGSVAIKDDLLIAVDLSGLMHCLNAKTGEVHWTHDLLAAAWASPLIVDDNAYVVDEDGDVAIFRMSANPAVAMKNVKAGRGEPIGLVDMGTSIYSSPVFANGVLYIATKNRLFAIAAGSAAPVAD